MMLLTAPFKKFEKIKKFYYTKILNKKYYRLGKCLKCGGCCENIYIRHEGKVISSSSEFEEIKKTDKYSFYQHISVTGEDKFGLIFSCNKFDKEKRICKDHKNRPSICRNYPSEEIFSFGAQLQDKCGFYFQPIESFDEIFKKVSKKKPKNFEQIN